MLNVGIGTSAEARGEYESWRRARDQGGTAGAFACRKVDHFITLPAIRRCYHSQLRDPTGPTFPTCNTLAYPFPFMNPNVTRQ
jgi:hypothetical protein